ncbi:hypothetical protein Cha6605_2867 [Chamaesiphon minutus PCC 6605]|uniref:Uncharacterized protein n=1 Tax=Chamaesiphon minutus (strain ATCC 27169 / PCC 6605) TaxID=1173020 RepID=K9UGY3_CHAP6|nr:hypothetical protein Cha6605_2867 [Chamaesiphon minutus PCC 6605]
MFGKYEIALVNPGKSPLTPLKRGEPDPEVPLLKGDLAAHRTGGSLPFVCDKTGGFSHLKRSN